MDNVIWNETDKQIARDLALVDRIFEQSNKVAVARQELAKLARKWVKESANAEAVLIELKALVECERVESLRFDELLAQEAEKDPEGRRQSDG
jgi:hypothetical protein